MGPITSLALVTRYMVCFTCSCNVLHGPLRAHVILLRAACNTLRAHVTQAFKPAMSFLNTVSKHERRCMHERRPHDTDKRQSHKCTGQDRALGPSQSARTAHTATYGRLQSMHDCVEAHTSCAIADNARQSSNLREHEATTPAHQHQQEVLHAWAARLSTLSIGWTAGRIAGPAR